jgi:hypothetical protein
MIKCRINKGLLTLYVYKHTDNTYGVRVNGKPVQKSYDTEEEAKQVAVAGAQKLVEQALKDLNKTQRWEK